MPCYDSLMVLVTVWQQSEEEREEGGREKVRERKGETEVNKRTDARVQRCRNVSALKMDGRQGLRIRCSGCFSRIVCIKRFGNVQLAV